MAAHSSAPPPVLSVEDAASVAVQTGHVPENTAHAAAEHEAGGLPQFEAQHWFGQIVYLRENSNISTGGDSIDHTDDIHAGYKAAAVRAAQAVGARICGADLIIPDLHAAPSADNYSIIELNFNPALHIHDHPFSGQNRHVEGKVLDLLGFGRKVETA